MAPPPIPVSRRTVLRWLALAPLPLQAAETVTSSLTLNDLVGSAGWPEPLQKLIAYALSLTSRKLGYQLGSADPDQGGMDCSGTIHHVLKASGIKEVPRQSGDFYRWAKAAGNLTPVTGIPALADPMLAKLKPGDLLFWSGTYDTGARALPISHVMIYLSRTKAGKPVMFGASDGRPYQGKRQNGVSVFDFRLPSADSKARLVAYGAVPGLDVGKVPAVPPVAERGTAGPQSRRGPYGKSVPSRRLSGKVHGPP